MIELAKQKPRFGYRRLYILLRRAGQRINHKRVQRVYRAAGLCVRRIPRKRLARDYASPPKLSAPNQEWAIDFQRRYRRRATPAGVQRSGFVHARMPSFGNGYVHAQPARHMSVACLLLINFYSLSLSELLFHLGRFQGARQSRCWRPSLWRT